MVWKWLRLPNCFKLFEGTLDFISWVTLRLTSGIVDLEWYPLKLY